MRRLLSLAALLTCVCVSNSFGQLPRIGVGAKISTLGVGFEGATAVTDRSNVRGGFNFFNYDHSFTEDGVNCGVDLRLRSVEALYDWFFGHGFHASPGLLVYNGNRAEGSASVPGGRSFTLGNGSYVSNPSNPIT